MFVPKLLFCRVGLKKGIFLSELISSGSFVNEGWKWIYLFETDSPEWSGNTLCRPYWPGTCDWSPASHVLELQPCPASDTQFFLFFPFFLFWDKVSLCISDCPELLGRPGLSWTLPPRAGIKGVCHHAWLCTQFLKNKNSKIV